mgnify:CR=1 FL=1
MKGQWIEFDVRDAIIDFFIYFLERSEIQLKQLLKWGAISSGKYYNWKRRYGKINSHNGKIPRDFWIQTSEKNEVINYFKTHPNEGYRRLCYMMIDENVVCISPTSVYRILKSEGLLRKPALKSLKGTGFIQPLKAHEEWHMDIANISIGGRYYYLISILDGFSRYLVHFELRESMTSNDTQIVYQRALDKYPNESPRLITDNGSQFISKDFKQLIKMHGLTHVRTSPYYPQSNGKIERFHRSIKHEGIYPKSPQTIIEGRKYVTSYINYYNEKRLHSALNYISPKSKLEGKSNEILMAREDKLYQARLSRQKNYLEKLPKVS